MGISYWCYGARIPTNNEELIAGNMNGILLDITDAYNDPERTINEISYPRHEDRLQQFYSGIQ